MIEEGPKGGSGWEKGGKERREGIIHRTGCPHYSFCPTLMFQRVTGNSLDGIPLVEPDTG